MGDQRSEHDADHERSGASSATATAGDDDGTGRRRRGRIGLMMRTDDLTTDTFATVLLDGIAAESARQPLQLSVWVLGARTVRADGDLIAGVSPGDPELISVRLIVGASTVGPHGAGLPAAGAPAERAGRSPPADRLRCPDAARS